MSWLPWRRKRKKERDPPAPPGGWRLPGLVELSSALKTPLASVSEAVRKCSAARSDELAVARRELAGALCESMTTLGALAQGVPPSSRVREMARFTAQELWRMAQSWVIFDFMAADWSSLTTAETADLQRAMWQRAEEVVAAPGENQEEARQLVAETEAILAALPIMSLSERQTLMWQLVVDEVVGFVSDALTEPSEQREQH